MQNSSHVLPAAPTGESSGTRAKGKIFSLFGCKGGSGTTTIAMNLAYEIRQLMQEPVLLLDLDQIYNNTCIRLNIKPAHCLAELAQTRTEEVDENLLVQIIVKHPHGIDILAGNTNILSQQAMSSATMVSRCLDYLQSRYSYIVVDIPSYLLDPIHQLMVRRSEKLLLVSGMELPSLYRAQQYINLAKAHADADNINLVINRWNLQGAYGLSNPDLEKELNIPAIAHLSDDWNLNVKTNSLGIFWSQLKPDAPLVQELQRMAGRLVDLGLDELKPLNPSPGFSAKNFFNSLFQQAGLATGLNLNIVHTLLRGLDLYANRKIELAHPD